MPKPKPHSPSKKNHPKRPAPRPRTTRLPSRPSSSPAFPTLRVDFESIEVRHNGWPGNAARPTDLSLVLQLEIPSAAAPNTALASARMPFRAASGQTVVAADLPPDSSGRPFFGRPVKVSNHVNLHARLFVDRTNAIGPILGAALNTVIGTFVGKIPLLGSPLGDVLHVQIGNVISTELARATAIVPSDETMKGTHPVAIALVAPRTIPGVYAPPGSPEGYRKGVVVTEGDLVALLHLTLTLTLPG
ncbi:MAG: hypothetical protein WCC53_07720 [Thermoanaerobaculia bacterium]